MLNVGLLTRKSIPTRHTRTCKESDPVREMKDGGESKSPNLVIWVDPLQLYGGICKAYMAISNQTFLLVALV